MSKYVSYQPVVGVFNHPNADRLSIVRVGGSATVHPTNEAKLLRKGDMVVRFPVGICIDPEKAEKLGVANYCKPALYAGKRSRCRVVTVKIRGVYSSGFIIPTSNVADEWLDLFYGVQKYVPPKAPVKLSVIKKGADWVYRSGAHNYLLNQDTMSLLNHLCDGSKNVTIFGKLGFGKPIESLETAYLVVDMIMVDYKWLDWDILRTLCELYNVETIASTRPGA